MTEEVKDAIERLGDLAHVLDVTGKCPLHDEEREYELLAETSLHITTILTDHARLIAEVERLKVFEREIQSVRASLSMRRGQNKR